MRPSVAILAGIPALALLLPAGAVAVCTQEAGQQNFWCDHQQHIVDVLPCGVTKNDDDQCYRLHTNEHGCTFALGDWGTERHDAVWWPAPQGSPKPPPSEGECRALEESVPLCSPKEQQAPGCPDPAVSGDCSFPCDDFSGPGGEDAARLYGWEETCRAYALMPRGWGQDPWRPAVGFFPVGKPFPSEALSWRVGDGPYEADDALAEGRLGPTVLGAAGSSPLWGRRKDGLIVGSWRKRVGKVGVCVNEPGALLASPYWERTGRKRFLALVNCDGAAFALEGRELWRNATRWDEKQWAASGALAADVLPRLKRIAGLELVCVTPELAQQRRRQRRP